MLKRYRNAIFAAVQKSGLPTDDFEIGDMEIGGPRELVVDALHMVDCLT